MMIVRLWGRRTIRIWRLLRDYRQAHGGAAGLLRLAVRVYESLTNGGIGALRKKIGLYEGRFLDASSLPRLPSPKNILALEEVDPKEVRLIQDVAVHAHIYYADLAPELRRYLDNIPHPVHLYLTTDSADKSGRIKTDFTGMVNVRAIDIRVVPNRGRDIGPMIVELGETLARHDVVLHIHTKRSPHNPELRGWRRYLLRALLGNPGTVAAILDHFARDDRLGVLYPQTYRPVLPFMRIGGNAAVMSSLLKRAGLNPDEIENVDMSAFPAGFMLWFRGSAIEPFVRMKLGLVDFDAEARQEDGTLAHAIERTFCYFASDRGVSHAPFLPINMFSRTHPGAMPITELLSVLGESISNIHIIFDHNIGGGANRYSRDLINAITADGCNVLRIFYADRAWFAEWVAADDGMIFVEIDIDAFFKTISEVEANAIIVNSLYMYPEIDRVIERIVALAASLGVSVDYKVHDFYAICPSQHLLDKDRRYCGVPKNIDMCNTCLRKNRAAHWVSSQLIDIVKWRQPFDRLLEAASTISVFDPSSVDIMNRAFHVDDAKIRVTPHDHVSFKHIQPVRLVGPLHIGVFGTLTEAKGSEIINMLAKHIAANSLRIPITVVGRSVVPTAAGIKVLGAYNLGDLPDIVERERINVFLMVSIIPETFSYTISEAMQMGLPIVALDIGAQGRRVKSYKWGRVAPIDVTPETLIDAIKEVHLSATIAIH